MAYLQSIMAWQPAHLKSLYSQICHKLESARGVKSLKEELNLELEDIQCTCTSRTWQRDFAYTASSYPVMSSTLWKLCKLGTDERTTNPESTKLYEFIKDYRTAVHEGAHTPIARWHCPNPKASWTTIRSSSSWTQMQISRIYYW